MTGKNVFITGATGFIGQHLTRQLTNNGYRVTALLRTPSKKQLLPHQVNIIEGNMELFRSEELVLPPFDFVIHLAGAVFANSDEEYMQQHYGTTKILIDCIERQAWTPKRFIYASSLAAAGPSGHDIMNEDYVPNPIDPYGRAKLATEKLLHAVTSCPVTLFRPAIVLGPGDANSLTLFQMAKFRLGFKVDGEEQKISFISVGDLNRGIERMLEDASGKSKLFFVAHPQQITSSELFETIGQVMDRKVWMIPLPQTALFAAMKVSTLVSELFKFENKLDTKQYNQLLNNFMCSGQALIDDLDWSPEENLVTTLQKAYDGYKADGWL